MNVDKQSKEIETITAVIEKILSTCHSNLVICGAVSSSQGIMIGLNEIDNEECKKKAKRIFIENDSIIEATKVSLLGIKDLIDKEIGKKKDGKTE